MHSNTTLVKVKSNTIPHVLPPIKYSNTTLVKVKFPGALASVTTAAFKYNSC